MGIIEIGFPTPEQIELWVEWLITKTSALWGEDISKIVRARCDPKLYDFLRFYCKKYGYEEQILTYNGLTYPILAFPSYEKQFFNIEHPLAQLEPTEESSFDAFLLKKGENYLNRLKELNPIIDNLWTYTLDTFDPSNLRLYCKLGHYEEMIKTCDVLEYEILTEWSKHKPNQEQFVWFFSKLQARSNIHLQINPFISGKLRSSAIAISTPIIYKDNKTYKMLTWERTNRVAVHGELVHVIPSFMFQPMVGNYVDDQKTEFKIQHHQIEREYLEEVFQYEDVKKPPKLSPKFEWYDTKPELRYLRTLLANGKAELVFTGIAFNLLNLRPEICTLLLIRDSEWIRNHQEENEIMIEGKTIKLKKIQIDEEEFKSTTESLSSAIRRDKKIHQSLTIDLGQCLEKPLSKYLQPWNTVPPGAAAAIFAVNAAKQRLGFK